MVSLALRSNAGSHFPHLLAAFRLSLCGKFVKDKTDKVQTENKKAYAVFFILISLMELAHASSENFRFKPLFFL